MKLRYIDLILKNRIKIESFLLKVLLFVVCLKLIIFRKLNFPQIGIDASWETAMNEAHHYNYQFGKDIIFTFGPFASVYTNEYHPDSILYTIIGNIIFFIGFYLSLLLAYNNKFIKINVFIITSIFLFNFYIPFDSLVFVYLILLSVVFLLKENLKTIFHIILVIPLGVLVLIKGSYILGICYLAFFLIFSLIIKRSYRKLIIIMFSIIISTLIFWILANQSVKNIFIYFINVSSIISGYTEAMSSNGGPIYEPIIFLIIGLFLLIQLYITNKNLIFLNLIIGLLFLSFKAGFTRHDTHAIIASTTLLLTSSLVSFNKRYYSLIPYFASLMFWLFVYNNHIQFKIPKNFKGDTSKNVERSLNLIDLFPSDSIIKSNYFENKTKLSRIYRFPNLDGACDIYSYNQSILLASENNWNPRPIPQSYSAYNSKLIGDNLNHLLSDSSPDYIFFNPETIDGRLPNLDDGLSWPILLNNYKPIDIVNNYLILRGDSISNRSYPNLSFIEKINSNFKNYINVPRKTNFVKIHINPSILGRIFSIIWKPSFIYLNLNLEDGSVKNLRIIPQMASSGFLFSHLIEDTEDFALLFSEKNYLKNKEIKSVSIATEHYGEMFWQKDISIEFFNFEFPKYKNIENILNLNKPIPIQSGNYVFIDFKGSSGNIDQSNDYRNSILFKGEGWLAESLEKSIPANEISLIFSDSNDSKYILSTRQVIRKDVGDYFGDNRLDSSGFSFSTDLSNFSFTKINLGFVRNDSIFICERFKF